MGKSFLFFSFSKAKKKRTKRKVLLNARQGFRDKFTEKISNCRVVLRLQKFSRRSPKTDDGLKYDYLFVLSLLHLLRFKILKGQKKEI